MRVHYSIAMLLLIFSAISQNPLPKGKCDINFGVGASNWGIPVYIGLDYGIHKDVTLGGEFSFRSHTHHWPGNKNYPAETYRHTMTGFAINGNYHFNSVLNIPKDWDFYAGLNVGFWYVNNYNEEPYYYDRYHRHYGDGVGLGIQIGGRYYFTDKVGLNLEVGGGNILTNGKIGLTIKI